MIIKAHAARSQCTTQAVGRADPHGSLCITLGMPLQWVHLCCGRLDGCWAMHVSRSANVRRYQLNFFLKKSKWQNCDFFKNIELIQSILFEVQIQIRKNPRVDLESHFALSLSKVQSEVIYKFKIHK